MTGPGAKPLTWFEGPHSARLGLRANGAIAVSMPFGSSVGNRGGRMHGGATASALVAAGRRAAFASERADPAREAHLLHSSFHFLAAPHAGSGVTADAAVSARGRDVAHIEAWAEDDAGTPVARGILAFAFAPVRGGASTGTSRGVDELTDEESRVPRVPGSPYLLAADVRVPPAPAGNTAIWMPVAPNGADDDPARIDDGALIALADSAVAYAAQRRGDAMDLARGVTISLSLLFHGVADQLVEAEGFAGDAPGRCRSASVVLRTKRNRRLVATGIGVFHLLGKRD